MRWPPPTRRSSMPISPASRQPRVSRRVDPSALLDLVVVPCGGKKLNHSAPAGELYIGSYHRACRRAAEALRPARILILSALHGLVELDQVLAPYDLRMGQPGSVTESMLTEQ